MSMPIPEPARKNTDLLQVEKVHRQKRAKLQRVNNHTVNFPPKVLISSFGQLFMGGSFESEENGINFIIVIFCGWKLRSVQIVAMKAVGGLFYCCYWLEVAVRVMFLLIVLGAGLTGVENGGCGEAFVLKMLFLWIVGESFVSLYAANASVPAICC
ncbi:unnamed protein product [Ilex paraguariensis]|uniref:Transmembrane protein n=1 Tax=Ilex paraguariensis TaxID=185542 RepID=A0ABC8QYS2_9AQUA